MIALKLFFVEQYLAENEEVFFLLPYTARPRDTRILVPEKNRAAQNRAS